MLIAPFFTYVPSSGWLGDMLPQVRSAPCSNESAVPACQLLWLPAIDPAAFMLSGVQSGPGLQSGTLISRMCHLNTRQPLAREGGGRVACMAFLHAARNALLVGAGTCGS